MGNCTEYIKIFERFSLSVLHWSENIYYLFNSNKKIYIQCQSFNLYLHLLFLNWPMRCGFRCSRPFLFLIQPESNKFTKHVTTPLNSIMPAFDLSARQDTIFQNDKKISTRGCSLLPVLPPIYCVSARLFASAHAACNEFEKCRCHENEPFLIFLSDSEQKWHI